VCDRGLSAELSANFERIEIREAEAEPEQQEHKERQDRRYEAFQMVYTPADRNGSFGKHGAFNP